MSEQDTVITVTGLRTQFGTAVIHDDLDLSVRRGEVLGRGRWVRYREIRIAADDYRPQ